MEYALFHTLTMAAGVLFGSTAVVVWLFRQIG
jgi:hypothetical protein